MQTGLSGYMPTSRESATLIAHLLITARFDSGRPLTRARLAPRTIKRVCNRERLADVFVSELALYLLNDHGLVLISTSINGSDVFGLIGQEVMSTWTSLTTKHIQEDLTQLKNVTTDKARESFLKALEGRLNKDDNDLQGYVNEE
jgi:hypothetical protein